MMACLIALMASTIICQPEQQAAYESQVAIELAMPLIRRHEGLRLRTYKDPKPGGKPLYTRGYGHTGHDVRPGQRITLEQAESDLRLDATIAAHAVGEVVQVPLSCNQRAALICFTFNVGALAFAKSGVAKRLNAGDYAGAARVLLLYCHAGKPPVVLPGLKARRQAEARLFNTPDGDANVRTDS